MDDSWAALSVLLWMTLVWALALAIFAGAYLFAGVTIILPALAWFALVGGLIVAFVCFIAVWQVIV